MTLPCPRLPSPAVLVCRPPPPGCGPLAGEITVMAVTVACVVAAHNLAVGVV
ncbi:hypothetical protein IAG44_01360 [Streptomyces roseirectus]|uniref:Uncharacterized protein n=1 Tax=Streptomyces roseirectus TaxID=2768066 RepID=A0A7H0ITV4_9ACTN|nr:hypothetical protein [Streptomyces roseirectus]QNP76220.1 hypothetical protein IAG44_01360 [Streptomyces roseirectus]